MTDRVEPPHESPPAPPGRRTLAGAIGAAAAAALLALLAAQEGKSNIGYFDVAGVATACYGDTADVAVGAHYSDADCAERLERQALAHVAPVLACTPALRGHDNQVVAAGSLAYNIGTAAYCRSGIARRFAAGDWRGACDGFLAWNRAGGRVVRGLVARRRAERALCLTGLPA
jgi:lysozyme